MTIVEIVFNLYFAFIGAYLSVILARQLRQNRKALDRMDERFRKMDESMDEGSRRMDEAYKLIGNRSLPPEIFLCRDWGRSDAFSTKGYRLSDILPGILIPQPACFNYA